ncbi:MAG TPA: MarC family protein [Gammaproteobacteria bacterium]|nr:MarC family protein [Gammaproteobacteria bacterium]
MNLVEITLLLFLVIDPFGNLPFVIAVLSGLDARAYLRAVLRELALAFLVLLAFALFGGAILHYLNIEPWSLNIAGGIILFLISLKMIFRSARDIFADGYSDNPILVPIAVPSIAGPSTITALIVLRTKEHLPLETVLAALVIVFLLACLVFLPGRLLSRALGDRGLAALEKFMGLLLNLVAVSMIMRGIRDFISGLAAAA